MSNAFNFQPDPNAVRDIPLDLIEIDHKWNSRSSIAGSGGPDGSEGYIGTLKSIAEKGQTTPATVMVNLNPESKKPYYLVTGFSRATIASELAAGLQPEVIKSLIADGAMTETRAAGLLTDKPTLRAIVKKMTWEDARLENLEENVARSQLSQPDIAFGVADLAKGGMKHSMIAAKLGMSQGHISMGIRILTQLGKCKLPPKSVSQDQDRPIGLIAHWRSAPVKLPLKEMDAIGKLPTEDEQIKAYLAKATTKQSNKTDTGLTQGRNAVVNNAINVHSKTMGAMFGGLKRQGVIAITGELFSPAFIGEVLLPLTKLGPKVTDDDKAEMALSFRKAFDEAVSFVPPETSKEEDDAAKKAEKEAEKAAAAAPKGATNGAPKKADKKKGSKGAQA